MRPRCSPRARLKFAQGPSEASETIGKGSAIRQTPLAGTEAEEGSTVTVVFSAGRSAFPVPDVIGKSESSARKALEGTPGELRGQGKDTGAGQRREEGRRPGRQPGPERAVPVRHRVHLDRVDRHGAGRGSERRHPTAGRRDLDAEGSRLPSRLRHRQRPERGRPDRAQAEREGRQQGAEGQPDHADGQRRGRRADTAADQPEQHGVAAAQHTDHAAASRSAADTTKPPAIEPLPRSWTEEFSSDSWGAVHRGGLLVCLS